MELSLTTFILEIINFLVLVWILKRLFFIPIKRAIEDRRKAVAKTLDEAKHIRADAELLHTQYEARNRDWEVEKIKARQELDANLTLEKEKRLQQIAVLIESERQKMQVQEERKAIEQRDRLEREAIAHALTFSSRLLESIASPELEIRLIDLTLEYLQKSAPKITSFLRSNGNLSCTVSTGFELSNDERNKIQAKITGVIRAIPNFYFTQDSSLIAGIEIQLGSTVIRANLRDELSFFSGVHQI